MRNLSPVSEVRKKGRWKEEYGIKLEESGIILRIAIQNPSSTDKYWNPELS